jgi:hypothetical protein
MSRQFLKSENSVHAKEVFGVLAVARMLGIGSPADLLRHPISDINPKNLALKNDARIQIVARLNFMTSSQRTLTCVSGTERNMAIDIGDRDRDLKFDIDHLLVSPFP